MSRQFLGVSLVLAILVTPLAIPTSASAWQFTAGGDANGSGRGESVVVDRNGHVVAAGSVRDPDEVDHFFVVKVNRKHGHEIWRFERPVASGARAVALDPQGHVVAAGSSGPSSDGPGGMTVIKLDRETGTPHWITQMSGGAALGVAVDAAGDVIAAGSGFGTGMGIVKLSGGTGAELWRAQPRGVFGGQARALALDRSGNVIVAGTVFNTEFQPSFAVMKLSGTDGSEQWRHVITPHEFSGGDEARAVAVDATGDVFAGGGVRLFTGTDLPEEFTVVKLAGGDGSVLWRHHVDPGVDDSLRALTLDHNGDVIAAGNLGVAGAVVKLAGPDGTELWRHASTNRSWFAVTADGTGNAVATGFTQGPLGIPVTKLAGNTGEPLWQIVINDPGDADDFAFDVTTDDAGDVVVAGDLRTAGPPNDFAVIKLSGATGADF
jgi:outer membrane protein assembly factor BamB